MPGRRVAKGAVWALQVDQQPPPRSETDSQEELLDLKGLRQELQRQQSRALKKASQTYGRLSKINAKAKQLLEANADLAELEACEDAAPVREQLETAQERIAQLAELEHGLEGVKNAKDPAYPALCRLATDLGVGDQPPPRPERGPKKAKGKKPSPRKPYWTFVSADGIQIRVGRAASDNDVLSCNPEHRDGQDWWMHAAMCPGSHVVIRSHADLPSETITDAAVLAAKYSKVLS